MNIIYAGPTLAHAEITKHLDCVCLPPISHGDILKLLPDMPTAIGIIDGYFEGAPSVWHKEILYAMDQGVHVYGSSSMGALRAAELYPFGMRGVGRIFEWYRDGVIEDDDEVAVLHGPEEATFMVASEPMVNIRATLELAQEQQVISESVKIELLSVAKNIFYKDRSWRRIMDLCDYDNLKHWLEHNRIDQKKRDAVQMLETMQTDHSNSPDVDYHFEWTNLWDAAYESHSNSDRETLSENDQDVLDQLRKDPDLFEHYREKALLSWLCDNPFDIPESDEGLREALKRFRADNRLDSRSQLLDYMQRTGLDEPGLTQSLERVSRVDFARQAAGNLDARIIDQLKLDGRYIALLETAQAAGP